MNIIQKAMQGMNRNGKPENGRDRALNTVHWFLYGSPAVQDQAVRGSSAAIDSAQGFGRLATR